MIRHKRLIEIRKQGQWITVSAIIDEEMLCRHPRCDRKPPGGSNASTTYCSTKCAQKHKRLLYLDTNKRHNKTNKPVTYNKIHIPSEI